MTTLDPIRREVLVTAEPAVAFAVFTERINEWWPLAGFSVHGATSRVAFDDGRIVEYSADGEEAVWGTVTAWEPGHEVAFTWHPGKSAEEASRVTVHFEPRGEQTLVSLEHSGWEVFADPENARSEYGQGWPTVLENYTRRVDAAAASTWAVLLHAPGKAAPAAGPITDDPRFKEHVAFLQRMHDHGFLVAAGPLTDTDGSGMTVLRLPGADRMAEAGRLATEDDGAVVSGLLRVEVRPWAVIMHAVAS